MQPFKHCLFLLFLLISFSLKAQVGDPNIYPNPFPDSTTFQFHVGKKDTFSFSVVDIHGKIRISIENNVVLDTGLYRYIIHGDSLYVDSVYYLKFSGGGQFTIRLIKAAKTTNIALPDVPKPYSLYASPGDGMLTLKAQRPVSFIELYDMQGRLLARYSPSSDSYSFQSPTKPGVYLLHISFRNADNHTERILVGE